MVSQPSLVSSMEAIIICIYGLFCTYVEYQVDHQKEVFRATKGKCEVWGKPAEFIVSIVQKSNLFKSNSICFNVTEC